ncbi:DNA polymerase III subunit gamma and tau [Corynebacterium auriscanis]|uniref:DNA polymerase III subunit gamma and tau n=1 Tax=Corynebacterium auriscanis TaxID=99807 RepID=UPI0022487347|nr:DNA polymerase III subunit gamma and tau [Corynebacterium auriscanis]MCX2162548.1 DNA polymerase III subunit gamma and tau [Corynebacterium auriscanis]
MALYRKYRPSTFAEVVGQAHVTEPLSTALDSGRINHAYLFSGPRGCGKTSSARIMARSLNCVEGPTSTPCGKCDSCRALAPGGAGHLDVTEIDAATHNGVEDMRDLRERAFFAPAESRYRVIIIDEAHMISQSGFNALLKIVEEPPEHLIFIFATTEPEKMLATIRSRTHNYPFRLLTPPDMRGLLESVVSGEGVPVEEAVYPLVIRAGGGSPRDSLSIMDQLLAGAGPDGVTYERAVGVLGMTDATLIDRAVESLADQDQAGLFTVVDEVIDAGYDPRRFAEDLLDRFRDLLMVFAVPDAVSRGLVNAPKDVEERLLEQSQQLGQATLTRCTALVNESLQQMRGATAPRLLLEIMCARMALPAAGMTVESLAQRVEQLERGGGLQVPGAGASRGAGAVGSGAVVPGAGGGAAGAAGGDTPRPRYERPKDRREREAREVREAREEQEQLQRQQAQPVQVEQRVVNPVEPDAPGTNGAPAPGEDDVLAQARHAREILDRHRGTSDQPSGPNADPAVEQPAEPYGAASSGEQSAPPEDGASSGEHLAAPTDAAPTDEAPTDEARTDAAPIDAAPRDPAPNDSVAMEAAPDGDGTVASSAAAPDAGAQPAPKAGISLTGELWQALLEQLKAEHLSTWVAARDAQPYPEQPSPVESRKLYVKHHTGALANYLNNGANAAVLVQAAQAVSGQAIRVIASTGQGVPAGEDNREVKPASAESDSADESDPAGARSAAHYDPVDSGPAHVSAPAEDRDLTESNTAAEDAPAESNPAEHRGLTESNTAAEDAPAEANGPHEPGPVSALERARAMAEARGPAHSAARSENATHGAIQGKGQFGSAPNGAPGAEGSAQSAAQPATQPQGEPTGWRARRDRMRSTQDYNRANSFNGVPLPDEPPEDPWESGPPDPNFYGGGAASGASVDKTANPPNGNDQPHPGAGYGNGNGEGSQPGQSARPAQPASEQELRRKQEEEILEELGRGERGELDHRTPLEVAGELIEKHLGGERVR